MHHRSPETAACIESCLACYQSCLGESMTHCLESGGKHVEPAHFRLMSTCAEICRTAAHLMLIDSSHAKLLCKLCADICDLCAADCEKLDGMEASAKACRDCAEACRKMAR